MKTQHEMGFFDALLPWRTAESEGELLVLDRTGDCVCIVGNSDSKTVQAQAKFIIDSVNRSAKV